MVRSYVRYEQSNAFGTVTSALANTLWTPGDKTGPRSSDSGVAVVGANEEVLRWDIKTGELKSRWRDGTNAACVTAIARSHADADLFAVGHDDGSIRLWDSGTGTVIINFDGHKSAVTSLSFDPSGVRLVSGAKDTDIIVWDLIAEVGLFKLRGHKDQVLSVRFVPTDPGGAEDGVDAAESQSRYLISVSKDALLKLWDIESQHCIETHIAQTNGECSAFDLSPDGTGCITAGSDGELKVWAINTGALANGELATEQDRYLIDRGILRRQLQDRTVGVRFHPRGSHISVHGADRSVEIWRIRTSTEIQRALTRKARRRREKAKAASSADTKGHAISANEDQDAAASNVSDADVGDVFVMSMLVRTGGKVRSTDWAASGSSKSLHLLASMTNNCLEMYKISTQNRKSDEGEPPEATRLQSVDLPGHRADVRAIALSSDDRMLATASNGALKIWNVRTETCLRTLECGYALCCSFLPGDKVVVVGTKDGDLQLFDIASSTTIDNVKAHDGAVWAMQVHPDGRSVVTGSADKTAKFWSFAVVQEEIPGTKRTSPRLKLQQTRVLKVNDDILSLCYSPNERLLAVSTLDNTVKIFFTDSLKLFLNLYGHKLPVLSMSISSDSRLITTSSADKNVRIWGLDFGDCHKALFAHNDSIMAVRFIPQPSSNEDAHFLISAGKDGLVKTWDGDKFEQVQKIRGHHGEVWALAVSRTGDFFVTASHDKSVRVWQQSDDPIFLDEERDREMEDLYGATLTTSLEADDGTLEGQDRQDGAVAASKQSVATLTAGERILEALEVGLQDLELMQDWSTRKETNPKLAPPDRDPLFLALDNIPAERHVLNTIQRIPTAQLHDALLILPFSALPTLFTFLGIWIGQGWDAGLACRVLFFMLKVHQRQLVGSKDLKIQIEAIKSGLRQSLESTKHLVGLNHVALGFVERRVNEKRVARLDTYESVENADSRKKRAFIDVS